VCGREDVHTEFWWRNPREGDHVEDTSVDWRIMLKWIFDKLDGSIDWIGLAQNKNRLRAFVNAVMNLWVS
jgi:hypothetical protein